LGGWRSGTLSNQVKSAQRSKTVKGWSPSA
jgi:hypothetical protein